MRRTVSTNLSYGDPPPYPTFDLQKNSSAELIKYAANAFLAMKVTFVNNKVTDIQ